MHYGDSANFGNDQRVSRGRPLALRCGGVPTMKSEPGSWLPITQPTAMFYAYEQVVNRQKTRRHRRRRRRSTPQRD